MSISSGTLPCCGTLSNNNRRVSCTCPMVPALLHPYLHPPTPLLNGMKYVFLRSKGSCILRYGKPFSVAIIDSECLPYKSVTRELQLFVVRDISFISQFACDVCCYFHIGHACFLRWKGNVCKRARFGREVLCTVI